MSPYRFQVRRFFVLQGGPVYDTDFGEKTRWDGGMSWKTALCRGLYPGGRAALEGAGSPHPFADIVSIDASQALAMDGVYCVLTHEDVPHDHPITLAAEAYPEGSTHDRAILERTVRYIGEPVAVVVARSEEIARQALRKIKVEYRLRQANFDFENAIDNGNPIFAPEEVFTHFENGASLRATSLPQRTGSTATWMPRWRRPTSLWKAGSIPRPRPMYRGRPTGLLYS